MGVLIEGAWREEELAQETSEAGEFKREIRIKTDMQETPIVVTVSGNAAD